MSNECLLIVLTVGNVSDKGASSSIPLLKEKGRYWRMKRNTMVQWMNLHRNNSFVNQTQSPLLCEKSGAILLVLVGLTADRLAIRLNTGRFGNFKPSLWIASLGFSQRLTKVHCYQCIF